jgi:NodT family efflux transporter outer membrane factor (OMF) lipoprotein
MQIKWLLGLLSAAVLSGCGLFGPKYNKPHLDTPANWNSTDKLTNINTSNNLPDTAWWKSFNDPVLNKLITYALKNNPSVHQAIGNIIQAQGALEQVKMGWVPTVNVAAGYGSGGTFAGNPNTAVNNVTVGANSGYQVGLVPSYTLNILQQLRSQELAEANLAAAQYGKDAIRLTILSQVAGGYFTWCGLEYQLKLQKQLVADLAKQLELGQQQYTQGYISLLLLQNYQQQYAAAKAQVPVLEYNIVQAQNALQALLNRNPGQLPAGINFAAIKMDGIIPINLPSTVLKNRPDVMQAEQQLIAANANIGVATANFFPSISLTGGVGSASPQLNSLFSLTNDFWKAAVSATMPVLNLSILGQIKGVRGAYYSAYYNYIQTVRNAFAQVDNGLATHDKVTQSYNDQLQVLQSTQISLQLGEARFKDGADSLVTMLGYSITMDKAAITLAQLKLQQVQSIINLYQALAGGYNVNNNATPTKFGDGHDA